MIVRLAKEKDLPEIQKVYRKITEYMKEQKIVIWDEIYPNDFFIEDIKNKEFYVLEKDGVILGGFALSSEDEGEKFVEWEKRGAPALYLNRLGVRTENQRTGLGEFLIYKAEEKAKEKGAEFLRLFVVDYNTPAIRLYEKTDFRKAKGLYRKFQGEITLKLTGVELKEYGYEKKL